MSKIIFSNSNVPNIFEKHGCTHSDFTKLLMDRCTGNLTVTEKKADEKIREVFCDICGVGTNESHDTYRKAVRRHQVDLFEIIEEVVPKLIVTGWDSNPFFMEYVDVRNLSLGQKNEFYTEDDTILFVNRLSGGHYDIQRQRLGQGSRFSIETEAYGLAIYAEFERLLANLENWTAFIGKIAEAWNVFLNDKLFAATMAAVGNIPNATQFHKNLDFSAADASREELIRLVEDVELWTRQPVAILGVRSALAKLRKLDEVDWISEVERTELYQTGRLGRFMGIPLIEIPNALNKDYARMFDDPGTKLLIAPTGSNANKKFIKLVYEGQPIVRHINDGTENLDMTYEYMYQDRLGLSTVWGYQFGTVDITRY